MNQKLNRKGFTLVELLAVIVILVAIMGIAIPTISSSLERTKNRQNESRYKIIETAAEEYVTDNKNPIYRQLDGDGTSEKPSVDQCYITISELSEYLSTDEMTDADGTPLTNGIIVFTRPTTYKFKKERTNEDPDRSCKG